MPGMNGYEITATLKKNPVTEKIPIILVTAYGGENCKAKALESGAEDFFEKPVNAAELLEKVKYLLS